MGLNILLNTTDQTVSKIKNGIHSALEQSADVVGATAVAVVPVDTGNLMRSINHKFEGENKVLIGTDVYYAGFVELGTSRMAARPYLRPALENNVTKIENIFRNTLA